MTAWRLGRNWPLSSIVYNFRDSICVTMLLLTRNVRIELRGVLRMNENDKLFLQMIHDPLLRAGLLERLEKLGLLSAFLEIENETTQ